MTTSIPYRSRNRHQAGWELRTWIWTPTVLSDSCREETWNEWEPSHRLDWYRPRLGAFGSKHFRGKTLGTAMMLRSFQPDSSSFPVSHQAVQAKAVPKKRS